MSCNHSDSGQLDSTSLTLEPPQQLRDTNQSVSLMAHDAAQEIPSCTAVNTYNTDSMPTNVTSLVPLSSHSNIISYSPTITGHSSTMAYQTFVPHPSFVSHPNFTHYSGISNQHISQGGIHSAISTGMPTHQTLMQLTSTSQQMTMDAAPLIHQQQIPLVQILQEDHSHKLSHLQHVQTTEPSITCGSNSNKVTCSLQGNVRAIFIYIFVSCLCCRFVHQ